MSTGRPRGVRREIVVFAFRSSLLKVTDDVGPRFMAAEPAGRAGAPYAVFAADQKRRSSD